MNFRLIAHGLILGAALCAAALGGVAAQAQEANGELRGQVTDPSGAAVADAAVLVTTPSGAATTATTNREGLFEVKGLTPGKYGIKVVAPGFAPFEKTDIEVKAGQAARLNISLSIEVQQEKVQVSTTTTQVDVNPANNAGAIVMEGKDLDALSDDPDEMESELQALAGPAAGPNGGQIYIDGFTAGQLPPKASIREIRINQNPFSAEYDKLGYGRIEIFTKPGTDKFHGQFFLTGNTNSFNSKNPFETLPAGTQPPGYYTTQFSAYVGGPLSKNASFFVNIERRNINDLSVVSAQIVDPNTFQIVPFSAAIPNPRTRTNIGPRVDYQLTKNNTLSVRYQYWHNNEGNNNVGGFNLASQATNSLETEHTLQATDTQTISPTTINETRFQFVRDLSNGNALSTLPVVAVQSSFTSGGAASGLNNDTENRYELQNITYISKGNHAWKLGLRARETTELYSANAGFNGSYFFGARLQPGCTPSGTNSCLITQLQAYQAMLDPAMVGATSVSQAIAMGYGPTFYSLNFNGTGKAIGNASWFDTALFFQDDYKLRPNMTFSYGLRYEMQNNLGDKSDFAPRLGFAWGLDGNGKNRAPKTVLRLGFGIFYDRFTENLVLQQDLSNGLIQQQYLVPNPSFFDPTQTIQPGNPQFPSSTASPQTVYVKNPNLRAPYIMQTGVTVERQLSKYGNLSVTYLNSRGGDQLFSNVFPPNTPGSPLPAGFNPADIAYQYASGGIFRQNQLIIHGNLRIPSRHAFMSDVTLFGFYMLNYANSDTSGAGYVPSVPGDLMADYGRASFDTRQRIFFGGTIGMRYGFRLSPFLVANSGSPFNITTGQDVYGDAQFNSRPAPAACGGTAQPSIVQTTYGCFNLLPAAGTQLIPINLGTSPARYTMNLRVSKTIGFGPKREEAAGGMGGFGGGDRGEHHGGPRGMFGGTPSSYRYNLTFSVSGRNIFNNVNLGTPIGNLSSPLFGFSNSLAGRPFSSPTANRLVDLQMQFTF